MLAPTEKHGSVQKGDGTQAVPYVFYLWYSLLDSYLASKDT